MLTFVSLPSKSVKEVSLTPEPFRVGLVRYGARTDSILNHLKVFKRKSGHLVDLSATTKIQYIWRNSLYSDAKKLANILAACHIDFWTGMHQAILRPLGTWASEDCPRCCTPPTLPATLSFDRRSWDSRILWIQMLNCKSQQTSQLPFVHLFTVK